MTTTGRRGFTLMEVMVAMAVGAIVVVGARGLVDALGTQAHATLRAARVVDAHANARDALQRLVGDLVVARDSIPSLTGDGEQATFTSYCESPREWMEPCRVTLRVEGAEGGYRVLWEARGDTVLLGDSLRTAAIRYLMSPTVGGTWTARWQNTVMLPVALGLVMDRDTLLAPIGDRQ